MGIDGRSARTLQVLLRAAGFAGQPESVRPLEGIGAMNRHWRVHVGGRDLVLREYGWPYLPPAPARARREGAVLDVLEAAGVPAPRALAVTDGALLETFEPGEVLGEVLARNGSADLAPAWHEAGRAWRRVHRIEPTEALRSMLAGGPQRRADTWYERVLTDTEAHLRAVGERRPDLEVDAARVRRLLSSARVLLEDRPVRLLHGDAHLWNVLVDRRAGRWTCASILDWELAEVGDPVWDLVGFHLLRRRDVGPTPDAFFDGYGDPGPPVVWGLYELVLHLWQAIDVAAWPVPLPSHRAAEEYLADLPIRLRRLERLTPRTPTTWSTAS
jgi:aminoglycoside phosphotransferase (APT) family kinase protein